MNTDNLQKFLIESIKKLQLEKGKFNATIDRNIDEVINDLKRSIKNKNYEKR
jgi:hypothetical protein